MNNMKINSFNNCLSCCASRGYLVSFAALTIALVIITMTEWNNSKVYENASFLSATLLVGVSTLLLIFRKSITQKDHAKEMLENDYAEEILEDCLKSQVLPSDPLQGKSEVSLKNLKCSESIDVSKKSSLWDWMAQLRAKGTLQPSQEQSAPLLHGRKKENEDEVVGNKEAKGHSLLYESITKDTEIPKGLEELILVGCDLEGAKDFFRSKLGSIKKLCLINCTNIPPQLLSNLPVSLKVENSKTFKTLDILDEAEALILDEAEDSEGF